MIKYVISIAFFIFNASAHNDDESFIIETKTKLHIGNQIYKNESKSFINKNFDKYKDSIFKVINNVERPMCAQAAHASTPACPPPTTIT